jgi:hypothetical protein
MFCVPQAIRKTLDQVLVKKILHNVYQNDKISETVNDLDSDGSSFSEQSNGDTCTVEYTLITRNKYIFGNYTHDRVTHVNSVGLLEFGSVYSTPYAVSVRMSRDRFLALFTMF